MSKIFHLTSRVAGDLKICGGNSRKYLTKADMMKRRMKEQKLAFGSLLETQKEKRRRLKKEKNKSRYSEASIESNVDDNSEASWIMKHNDAQTSRLRCVPEGKGAPNDKAKAYWPRFTIKHYRVAKSCDVTLRTKTTIQYFARVPKKEAVSKKPVKKQENVVSSNSQLKNIAENICLPTKSLEENAKSIPVSSNGDSKILKNIEGAPLFYEERGDLDDFLSSSRILSVSPTADEHCLEYPSVTRILSATMSQKVKLQLECWKSRMIRDLGIEVFEEYQADLLASGKTLHDLIDKNLRKMPVVVPENMKLPFNSVRSVLSKIARVRAIESHVVHPHLGYRGVIDCVASYGETTCLIEWKKSDRQKNLLSSTYDAPLQLASYIGALNADKNYPFQVKAGLLVIIYSKGEQPTVYPMDQTTLQSYWMQWLERLKQYHLMMESSNS